MKFSLSQEDLKMAHESFETSHDPWDGVTVKTKNNTDGS